MWGRGISGSGLDDVDGCVGREGCSARGEEMSYISKKKESALPASTTIARTYAWTLFP